MTFLLRLVISLKAIGYPVPDFEFDLDEAAIEALALESFKEANELFASDAAFEITSAKWDWPNAPSPRDIVDDGVLRDSYVPSPGRTEYSHDWTAEYAELVRSGATFKADSVPGKIWINLTGKPEMPGRDWTEKPLKEFNANMQKILDDKVGDL